MLPFDPAGLLRLLLSSLRSSDASPGWDDADDAVDDDGAAACDPGQCALDRISVEPSLAIDTRPRPPGGYVDLEARAAAAKYADGRVKRTAFPLVDLSRRKVVIVLHQMGVELARSWPSWHRVTCHRGILPDASISRVHPIRTRLIAANRVDRAPWHALSIEIAVNGEGVDGSGRWANPERNGRGRVSDAQIEAGRACVVDLQREVAEAGGEVVGILPHVTTGRDKRGRPNRQICPGSRPWGEIGEWAGAVLGIPIPGPGWALGGLPIPATWYHPRWRPLCERFIAA